MRNPIAFAVGFVGGWAPGTVGAHFPDPEAGLTLTRELQPYVDLDELHSRSPPVVYAVDFTGLTATTGVIWESGGAGVGASLCVSSGNITLRAGDGGFQWPANCSYIVAPCPTGDGTLVWEINSSTVRIWWNGDSLGAPTGTYTGDYAGGDPSGFLRMQNNITAESPTNDFTGFTTSSLLRYYEGQVSSM